MRQRRDECRFFAGMSESETAAALGVSVRTARRDWREEERAEFVEGVCDGDLQLRHELLRLLGLVESSEQFLESPAIDIAAPLFRDRSNEQPELA